MNMNEYLNTQDTSLTHQVYDLEKLSLSKSKLADKLKIRGEIKCLRAIQSALRKEYYTLELHYEKTIYNDMGV